MDDKPEYSSVTKNGAAIAHALMAIWERFGRPEDFQSLAGRTLLKEILSVWQYFYRQEYENAIHDNKMDILNEKSATQMEGYIPISYPPTLFNLIKAMFPRVNLSSRKTQRVIQELAPYLKTTRYRI